MLRYRRRKRRNSFLLLLINFYRTCPATAALIYSWWIIYLIPLLIDFIFHSSLTTQLNLLCQRNGRIYSHGEIWRPLTCLFIHHKHFSHIYLNTYGFVYLGLMTERAIGAKRFFQLFFLIGIGSNLIITSFCYAIGYGASSGIEGMVHFLCIYYLAYSDREWFYYVIIYMLIDMIFDITLMHGRHMVSIGFGDLLGFSVILWNQYITKKQMYFSLNFHWYLQNDRNTNIVLLKGDD